MDTNTFNNLISQTWPDLHAASTLGGGTFGTVYACTKTDAVTGVTQKEAVKVVRVDFTPEDRANAEEEGIPFADYYRAVKEKRLQEIRWMVALKSPHIVHINGYTAIEEPDLSALYILIRMDCLTALDQLRTAHLDDTPEQAPPWPRRSRWISATPCGSATRTACCTGISSLPTSCAPTPGIFIWATSASPRAPPSRPA